jgi:hypothetical protein
MQEISRELLEKLLTNYDPDTDLTSGGPADVQIIQPLLDRLDPDPVEVPFIDFAKTLLSDRFTDLQFEEGDALAEAVLKPAQFLMRPLLDQAIIILRNQSLENWTQMSEEEIDSLLSNFFFTREEGNLSAGTARIYFSTPISTTVGTGNVFTSKAGLRFLPSLPQSISADVMLTNKEGNLYYFDVFLFSEEAGTAYNIGVDEITNVSGLDSAVKVTNKRKFSNGTTKQSDEDAVTAAQLSIAERSITTAPGIITRLSEDIPAIQRIRVVGFGDDEMTRDILKGGGIGTIVDWGTEAEPIDDGDGDNSSTYIRMYLADFTQLIGPAGAVGDGWVVTFAGEDYDVEEVVDATTLKVSTEITLESTRPNLASGTNVLYTFAGQNYVRHPGEDFSTTAILPGHALRIDSGADAGWYKILAVGRAGDYEYLIIDQNLTTDSTTEDYYVPFGSPWYLRRNYITLSDIPGGLSTTSTTTIPDDTVHVGGMVDVYASGDTEDRSATLLALTDQSPLVSGTDLEYVSASVVQSILVNFEDSGILANHLLIIDNGTEAGNYRIVAVSGNELTIDGTVGTFSGAKFHVSDVIDVELTDPRIPKATGTDGRVVLGTSTFTTDALTNFGDAGVEVGDFLEIETGQDIGTYEISAVTGTGFSILTVAHSFSSTQNNLTYEVFKGLDAVDTPLVSVSTVEQVDTNEEPTGIYVPYGKPVDGRALGLFTNIGEGIDETFETCQLGIVGTADISGPINTIDGDDLVVSVDETNYTVTFSGTGLSYIDIVDQINDEIPNIAYALDVGSEKRLALQSVNRHIRYQWSSTTSDVRTALGLSGSRDEYNSQIIVTVGGSAVDLQDYAATKRSIVETPDGKYYRLFDIASSYSRAYSVLGGEERFWLSSASTSVNLGTPSIGIGRFYFKDPTYFNVQGPKDFISEEYGNIKFPWESDVTEITTTIGNATYKFYPDFGKEETYYPADSDAQPNNLVIGYSSADTDRDVVRMLATGAGQLDNRDTVIDFFQWGAELEDIVEITTQALIGDRDLTGTLSVDGKVLEFILDGVTLTVTFDANDTALSDVVSAINEQVGETIAYEHSESTFNYLMLETDKELSVVSDGDPDDGTRILLSTGWEGKTVTNIPQDAGEYKIKSLDSASPAYAELQDFDIPPSTVNFRKALVDTLNEIKAEYNDHIGNTGGVFHSASDSTNTITSSITYTSTEAQLVALWNEIVADYDLHDSNNGGAYHTTGSLHQTAGIGSVTSIEDIPVEILHFRMVYHDHCDDAAEHNAVDTVNVLDEKWGSNVHYKIKRQGAQAISPALMAANADDNGLYYVDIELASEGIGNIYNVEKNTRFVVGGVYDCFGYYVTNENEAVAYSTTEKIWIHFTSQYLDASSTFSPGNFIFTDGQNVQVNYVYSDLVEEIQEYLLSDQVRNMCQNPMAKHLLPAYVYLFLEYTGGSTTSVLEDDMEELIEGWRPEENFSVYAISQLLNSRNAEEMTNPVELVALAWESDRDVRIYRSENELDMGVRYALFVGNLNLSRL